MRTIVFLVGCALAATSASAQQTEIGYPEGSLGFGAIMNSDYAAAERQILNSGLPENDVGRALNLGFILAKTGRTEQAATLFTRVLKQEDVELVLADDSSISSHEAARRALTALRAR